MKICKGWNLESTWAVQQCWPWSLLIPYTWEDIDDRYPPRKQWSYHISWLSINCQERPDPIVYEIVPIVDAVWDAEVRCADYDIIWSGHPRDQKQFVSRSNKFLLVRRSSNQAQQPRRRCVKDLQANFPRLISVFGWSEKHKGVHYDRFFDLDRSPKNRNEMRSTIIISDRLQGDHICKDRTHRSYLCRILQPCEVFQIRTSGPNQIHIPRQQMEQTAAIESIIFWWAKDLTNTSFLGVWR